MEELDPLIKHPEADISRLGTETPGVCVAGRHSTKELASRMFTWIFWTFTLRAVQCMTLVHTARSESSNEGSPGYGKLAIAFTWIAKRVPYVRVTEGYRSFHVGFWGHQCGETCPELSPSTYKAPRDRHVYAGDRTPAACDGDYSTKELASQWYLVKDELFVLPVLWDETLAGLLQQADSLPRTLLKTLAQGAGELRMTGLIVHVYRGGGHRSRRGAGCCRSCLCRGHCE